MNYYAALGGEAVKPAADKKGGSTIPFEYAPQPSAEPPKPVVTECEHGKKIYTFPDGTKMATCGNKH